MQFSRYMVDWGLSVIRKLNRLNFLITGKNQLYGTALPCWSRLTHFFESILYSWSVFYSWECSVLSAQVSPLSPPIGTCPFYIKHSFEWVLKNKSGTHLLSHAVSSIVPSAVQVLTIVFGMGTGVSPGRIATGNIELWSWQLLPAVPSRIALLFSMWAFALCPPSWPVCSHAGMRIPSMPPSARLTE